VSADDREARAAKIDRNVRYIAFSSLITFGTGVMVLVTQGRLGYLVMAFSALSASSIVSQRRLARQIRAGSLPKRATSGMWAQGIVMWTVTLVVLAGFGYFLGGRWLAVALPVLTILTTAILLLTVRRRLRR
jgi:hypothetical protein